jgi:hypothetical protein
MHRKKEISFLEVETLRRLVEKMWEERKEIVVN